MPIDSGGSNNMKTEKNRFKSFLITVFLGNQYAKLTVIEDQVRYLTLNFVFIISSIPLIIFGYTVIITEPVRAYIDFGIAAACIISVLLMRSPKVPFDYIPYAPVTIFALYCVYLLYVGSYSLWIAVWLFAVPPICIFMCKFVVGLIHSLIGLAGIITFLFLFPRSYLFSQVRLRIFFAYLLILGLIIVYDRITMIKAKKEKHLRNELTQERDVIQTMKDNINQGIFMMDKEMKILPNFSKPLITILSYYDSELTGKNFLDILSSSLDAKQLQTMKGYFSMVFSKSKSQKVLAAANPISEFSYKVDNRTKTLITRFNLIEQVDSEPVIIGIIQDITREKEYEQELQAQKDAQELEMKNMFDVIQIDPLVFNDFIDDTEANFNYINDILKDRSLTERHVLTKFFQNIHAIKANALILGLETFGKKLHALEDEIKAASNQESITPEDVLDLALKLENIMREKDTYMKVVRKIEAYKTSNQMDTILTYTLTKAVEKLSAETQKKAELKAGQVDLSILESKLRKPIKDILFQCVRNSFYHGIEPVDERIEKNKRPTSLLVFSIKNIDGKAEVTFSDDGRGLDWEKIKSRYIALHPDAKNINSKTLLSAIFMPEFSTSSKTTELAGRGVGLSLVKDLIKEHSGTIKVDSSDSGLTFKFTFPLAS